MADLAGGGAETVVEPVADRALGDRAGLAHRGRDAVRELAHQRGVASAEAPGTGGAAHVVAFGAQCRLEKLGRTFPPVENAAIALASAMRRVLVALEPAIAWGERSTAILADWT